MTDLVLEGLSARVDGFRMGPVDLQVPEGTATAVIGPSGAGKTTLLRTVAGFLPSTGGRVLRDGRDLTRADPEARSAVYVPQGLALFPHRTVRANVRYPRDLTGEDRDGRETEKLLERFGLTALAERIPAALSTGEQHRVAAARAVAARPALLLWDEPLAALDLTAREELLETLRAVREETRTALLLVTHDPALAFSLADRVLVLERGRPRYHGPVDGLIARPPDVFSARFVGYENVYGPESLRTAGDSVFGRRLLESAGPEGVGMRAPSLDPEGPWTGEVRSVEPVLGGFGGRAVVEGFPVRYRGSGPRVRPGEKARFSVPDDSLVALGGPGAGDR